MIALLLLIVFFYISVALHEFGHYITAKLFGWKVYEFSVGIGPKLAKWKEGETDFSIGLVPLAGQVSAVEAEHARLFQKLVHILAGVTMNLIAAFVTVAFLHGRGFVEGVEMGLIAIQKAVNLPIELIMDLGNLKSMFSADASLDHRVSAYYMVANSLSPLRLFAFTNLLMIAENLIPIPALDGGRAIVDTVRHTLIKFGVSKEKIDPVVEWILKFSMAFIFASWIIPTILSDSQKLHINPLIYSIWILLIVSMYGYIVETVRKRKQQKAAK